MVGTGGSDMREAMRTAIMVETLISAIQIPTISEETPENSGYNEITTPVMPTRITEEYQR